MGFCLGLSTVFLAGLAWALVYTDAPRFFPIAFGLFSLLFMIGALSYLSRKTYVRVKPGTITVENRTLGIGTTKILSAEQVVGFYASVHLDSPKTTYYEIRIRKNKGRPVIAGTMIGVCESLLYGYKAGLDLKTMLRSISGGAAACWTLDNMAPRILQRNFDPGFFVEHFIKDMGIALDEARRMGIVLPGLALVSQLYMAVRAQGHGKLGTQALILALEQLSRTEVKP